MDLARITSCGILMMFVGNLMLSQEVRDEQVLTLKSMDQHDVVIHILMDDLTEMLSANIDSDQQLHLYDFRGLVSPIEIVGQHFLMLHTHARGGLGVKIERLCLLCVNHEKLCIALDILSRFEEHVGLVFDRRADSLHLFDENSFYQVTIGDVHSVGQSYNMSVTINDTIRSRYEPETNHSVSDSVIAFFDDRIGVFATGYTPLQGEFTIDDAPGTTVYKREFFQSEIFPSIELGRFEYFFIDASWYMEDVRYHLVRYTSR